MERKTYEPTQLSTHEPFRAKGGAGKSIDEQLPGELVTNERFAAEDVYTNRTRNPRIGTHGAYEAAEAATPDADDADSDDEDYEG